MVEKKKNRRHLLFSNRPNHSDLATFLSAPFQGYGTDAFVFLRAVAENAQEVLPSYSERELRYKDLRNKQYDWMNPE